MTSAPENKSLKDHAKKKQKTEQTSAEGDNMDMSPSAADNYDDEPSDLAIAVMMKAMRTPDINIVEPLRTESDDEPPDMGDLDPMSDSDIPPRPQREKKQHKRSRHKDTASSGGHNRSDDKSQKENKAK